MNLKPLSLLIITSLYSCAIWGQSPKNDDSTVKVLCSNKIDQREVAYDELKNAWCDTTLLSFCALNKRRAIKTVCSDIYKNRLVRRDRNKSQTTPIKAAESSANAQGIGVQISSYKQEQLDIEIKRLEIGQRRLELRRKELELLKKQKQNH